MFGRMEGKPKVLGCLVCIGVFFLRKLNGYFDLGLCFVKGFCREQNGYRLFWVVCEGFSRTTE
jgi:hypothetical protein